MYFSKLIENPNFLTCRQTCPFPETTTRLFRIRKSDHQLGRISRNADCCLARFEKIRLTLATSCKDRDFRCHCKQHRQVVWIIFSAESSDFFVGKRKIWSFLELYSKSQFNRPLLDPFTKIFLDLQLVASVSSIFVSRVSTRNDFRNQTSAAIDPRTSLSWSVDHR